MTGYHTDSPEDLELPDESQSPLHGFRGDLPGLAARKGIPASLTIALSREAGARGTTIAKRAGDKLGWQVYTQELLEYVSQEGNFRQEIVDRLTSEATAWVEEQLKRLQSEVDLGKNASVLDLARMVLSLGALGEVVLLGRGAGFLLPAWSTLHVRLVAPLSERVAYMSQWLRLTEEEAAREVQQRDIRRAEFVSTHFQRRAAEVCHYDLILNSSLLGEELCADLIVQAAKAKLAVLTGGS